jgi:predicted nucleic acid-binding protein
MKKKTAVFDSFALLALFENEKGAVKVKNILTAAVSGDVDILLSVINWGEIYYIVLREYGMEAVGRIVDAIRSMPVTLVPVDESLTIRAATLKAAYPISYVDTFAAALTGHVRGILVTGDREFEKLKDEIDIEWI